MDCRWITAVTFALCSLIFRTDAAEEKLIVILVDGVRWDYINDSDLKGFKKMAENGVRAPYVVPVFPSLSYPNYQTIATGLYPENHGFVSNHMYDEQHDSLFNMIPEPGSTDTFWWEESEPIWITAEKNGLNSGLYWWAGCEVRINQTHPTICERQRYADRSDEDKEDFSERFEDILLMFKTSKKFRRGRLSLALMYYGSVDFTGHFYGPESSQRKKALKDVDEILEKLLSKIKKAGLQDTVNVMVVADHGMTDVSAEKTKRVQLDKYANYVKYQMDYGAVSMLLPTPGNKDVLYELMKNDNIEGIEVFKKEDIPEKYHIKNNNRTLPLFVKAKKGYSIDKIKTFGHTSDKKGNHGYDPEEVLDMRTIFVATGPSFRKDFVTEPLYTIDMYNIMCSVLGIQGHPNNGSWERVAPMLKKSVPTTSTTQTLSVALSRTGHLDLSIYLILLVIGVVTKCLLVRHEQEL